MIIIAVVKVSLTMYSGYKFPTVRTILCVFYYLWQAYATQQAWIQCDTVLNNVLFGQPLDEVRQFFFCEIMREKWGCMFGIVWRDEHIASLQMQSMSVAA